MAVATSGNSLSWTPDTSLHAGVYRIYWIPSENTQPEVDSPTFTLGNSSTSSSTNTNSASHSQIPSTSPIESNPSTGATVAPTTHTGTALASSVAITIAISIILAITLIMLVAFILLRRQRYLATIPRTKRQLTTKEIADDGNSWCEEQSSKPGAPAESEAMARSRWHILI
ncbi:hypothetical protein DID88_000478 [Monilinia fructigena]|uniref:Mid2 domain-containing protein n=1 Tax=Monilinia fructigena TaxID=38457 RepID=A0A395IN90_9HELO|nr:hypothetical protein DID88_000478 [Monilinia fructigena]